jgi:acetyl esterase/lipase
MSQSNERLEIGPARNIFPAPLSISAEAQAVLNMPAIPLPSTYPDPGDLAGWRDHVTAINEQMTPLIASTLPQPGVAVTADIIADVPIYRAVPAGGDPAAGDVFMDIHGGALIYLGGEAAGIFAGNTAYKTGMTVIAPDYRMPPDHLYPAALDDCLTVYRALVAQHGADHIIVGGSSAGGNLAAAMILRARDEGLPLPAGAALLTPEVDLTESGDSFRTILGLDRLGLLMPVNRLYAGEVALDDPYISPLFGDFSKGFPRTFLQSGTRDLFLSNTVRMHRALRKAGVDAELHVWEAMPHGGFGDTVEDGEVAAELRRFVKDCLHSSPA